MPQRVQVRVWTDVEDHERHLVVAAHQEVLDEVERRDRLHLDLDPDLSKLVRDLVRDLHVRVGVGHDQRDVEGDALLVRAHALT